MNGVSIFDAVDVQEEDAYKTEGRTMDACGAHSDLNNRYNSFIYHLDVSTASKLSSLHRVIGVFPVRLLG